MWRAQDSCVEVAVNFGQRPFAFDLSSLPPELSAAPPERSSRTSTALEASAAAGPKWLRGAMEWVKAWSRMEMMGRLQ